jgi:co-chaperonin GroES (HSP10)
MKAVIDHCILQIDETRGAKTTIGGLDIELFKPDCVWVTEEVKRKVKYIKDKDHRGREYTKELVIEEGQKGGEEQYNHVSEDNAIYKAEVICPPSGSAYGVSIDIEPGDKVYVHHLIASDDSNLMLHEGKAYRKLHYSQVFCKIVDGEPEMIKDFIFVEPIYEEETETENGIIDSYFLNMKTRMGIVKYINKDSNVEIGDLIIFEEHHDYLMRVEGKQYFKMRNDSVIATVPDEYLHKLKFRENFIKSRRKQRKLN